MKNKFIYVIALVLSGLFVQSCNTDKLTDLNNNPDVIDFRVPEYLFTNILLNCSRSNTNLHDGMQYTARYKDVPDIGGKQYDYLPGIGFGTYSSQLNRIQQCMEELNPAEDVNKIAALKIMRVYAYHVMTDAMGDIPYSEAQKGLEGNFKPKYDTQQSIYYNMFEELKVAINMMDASKPTFKGADVFYGGDIVRWKKFANTLMLRLAMRLSNKDAETAKEWAVLAINGGLMTEQTDIAYLKFNATATNPRAPYVEFEATQDPDNAQGGKLASTFVNHLKNTRDPRIYVLSVVWTKVGNVYVPDTAMANQKGMVPGSILGLPDDFETYSEYSPIYWNRETSPLIVLTPAEAYLLKAEAILRGWYPGTADDEKTSYNLAVTSAMKQWVLFPRIPALAPNINTISDAQINAYLTTGYPYKTTGSFTDRLEQISVQKWVSLLGDDFEIWSNWRRTGYPVFNWKNWNGNNYYPGSVTQGEFFRRMPLPDETASNNENQQEAVIRQGFPLDVKIKAQKDALLSRVWWDKP